ncbi:MAG: Uma2 family endonuclease [Actinomycetota bacterium]|nr:Uma2 family endonuclease [Actinomycetota bacterium]
MYEPDALVSCGPRLPGETIIIPDPIIIVEVLSPSTQSVDLGSKLEDYFRIESVRHYLIVNAERQAIIHHERATDGSIATRIIRDGTVRLDPPGIELQDIFAA